MICTCIVPTNHWYFCLLVLTIMYALWMISIYMYSTIKVSDFKPALNCTIFGPILQSEYQSFLVISGALQLKTKFSSIRKFGFKSVMVAMMSVKSHPKEDSIAWCKSPKTYRIAAKLLNCSSIENVSLMYQSWHSSLGKKSAELQLTESLLHKTILEKLAFMLSSFT